MALKPDAWAIMKKLLGVFVAFEPTSFVDRFRIDTLPSIFFFGLVSARCSVSSKQAALDVLRSSKARLLAELRPQRRLRARQQQVLRHREGRRAPGRAPPSLLKSAPTRLTRLTRLTAADSFSFILLPHNYVVIDRSNPPPA